MKSIEDTLRLMNEIVAKLSKQDQVNIAMIGGYAVIAHGVERTTSDDDFCVYSTMLHHQSVERFTTSSNFISY